MFPYAPRSSAHTHGRFAAAHRLALALAVAVGVSSRQDLVAQALYVPNGSFEAPETAFADPRVEAWQKTPKPDWFDEGGDFTWDQLTGVFLNTAPGEADHIDNVDGKQALFLFAVPQVGLSLELKHDPGLTNGTPPSPGARFEPGRAYELAAGVLGGGGGMTNGVSLELALYYPSPSGESVVVAATNLVYDPERFSGLTHLDEFRLRVPTVRESDAWAHQTIGIRLLSTVDPALAGGYWDVDHVRLSEVIEIPNASFEAPETAFADPAVETWRKTPKPDWYDESGGFTWDQLTGVFLNNPPGAADHIDNLEGNQALFLFAVPQVGILIEADADLPFAARYQPGQSYRLTAGLLGGGGGMTNGASLEMALFSRDDHGNEITVASTNLVFDLERFPSTTHLEPVELSIPGVRPGDPWSGRPVGIRFVSTVDPALAGGYWDLDQVRLTSERVGVLSAPAVDNGTFQAALRAEPGTVWELLAAESPVTPGSTWNVMGTVTNLTGTVNLKDPAAGSGARFYQVRRLP